MIIICGPQPTIAFFTGATGTGAVGTGAVGTGVVGRGATGRGAVGNGATVKGAVGIGATGIGVDIIALVVVVVPAVPVAVDLSSRCEASSSVSPCFSGPNIASKVTPLRLPVTCIIRNMYMKCIV